MKFPAITLIVHAPDPITGGQKPTTDRFQGNGTAQRELINVTPDDQWERNAESYEQRAFQQRLGLQPVFTDLGDFVARSSALIGSPA